MPAIFDSHQNFANGVVLTAPSPATSGASLTIQSGQGANFPATPAAQFYNLIVTAPNQLPSSTNSETVRVSARATDTFTITRAQEGSSARSVQVGDWVFLAPTSKNFTDIETSLGNTPAQNGVLLSTDLAPTAPAVTGGGTASAAIAATGTASVAWVQATSGILVPITYAGASPSSAVTVTSGDSAIVGIEIDVTGTIGFVTGANAAGNLAIGSLTSPATTSGKMRLMDIAVANVAGTYQLASTTIATQGTNWRDRRPWARGALIAQEDTSATKTTASTTAVAIDTTHQQWRVECTGVPIRIRVMGFCRNSTASTQISAGLNRDGTAIGTILAQTSTVAFASNNTPFLLEYIDTPAAGSHLYTPTWWVSAGTGSLNAIANDPLMSSVEELVRPNASNGTI